MTADTRAIPPGGGHVRLDDVRSCPRQPTAPGCWVKEIHATADVPASLAVPYQGLTPTLTPSFNFVVTFAATYDVTRWPPTSPQCPATERVTNPATISLAIDSRIAGPGADDQIARGTYTSPPSPGAATETLTWDLARVARPAGTPEDRIREYECNNGEDDDGDGWVDASDPGCAYAKDDSERHDPVRLYAPELHLHPSDAYRPMDPTVFARHSNLKYAVSRCKDRHVHGLLDTVGELANLANGRYKARIGKHFCQQAKTKVATNRLTALPLFDKPGHVPKNRREGFFLNLDNKWRGGIDPSVNSTLPMYYSYKPAHWIVYWLFYGYNDRAGDKHEGDWEKVVIRLLPGGKASSAAYYQHYCHPDDSDYGQYTWTEMQNAGYLAADSPTQRTHPIVYSAIGGHASYPEDVGVEGLPCGGPNNGGNDRTAKGGPVWRTWLPGHKLTNAKNAPWYGFGGSWGERKTASDTNLFGWGPAGPSPVLLKYVPPHPANW